MKKKIEIMRRGSELSDEEIQSHMDFEGLMSNVNKTIALRYRKLFLRWGISAVLLLGVSLSYYFYSAGSRSYVAPPVPVSRHHNMSAADPVNSSITKPEEHAEKESHPQKSTPVSGISAAHKIASAPSIKNETPASGETLYVQAEPIAGYPALYDYFNSQLVYPAEALHDSIQGVETISLVISTEGKPEQIRIIQSLGEPFEKEAIRLIQNMPQWKPSTLNGKPVPSKISLPITFQLKKFTVKK